MSITGGPDISENGLVLYLDASNRRSYPGSGTVWNDLSGRSNNGTLVNTPTFDGGNGGGIGFNGSTQRVDLPDIGLTEGSAFSISFWAKKSGGSGDPTVYSEGTPANWSNNLYVIYFGDSNFANNACRVYFGNGFAGGTSTVVTDGKWYFITYNQTATNSRNLYTNAVLEGTNTTNITGHSATNASIGANNNNGSFTQFTNATIACLFNYNRALTATEILQNYNATRSRFGL